MADFRIRVIVDPTNARQGVNQVRRDLNNVENTARRLSILLGQALGFAGLAAGIQEFVRLNDVLTNTQNRLRLVTDSTAELNAVTDELFAISNRTRSSFEATATVYSRTALSVRNLGLSQQETLDFTESLNQAVILSGASAQEASFALIQLSQGLASGTLRGDELRSVLEQLPFVADVIAERLGVTRGELRLLGQEGRINAQTVIDAFTDAADRLDNLFANTIPTISQAFGILRNNLIESVGDFNEATGFSETFARAIITLAENLDILGDTLLYVGSIAGGVFVARGLAVATRGVQALTAAILANPLGALATLILAVVTALIAFSDRINVTADGLATLDDFGTAAFTSIGNSIDALAARLEAFANASEGIFDPLLEFAEPFIQSLSDIVGEVEFSFGGILIIMARVADSSIGIWLGMINTIVDLFSELPTILGRIFDRIVLQLTAAAATSVNAINQFFAPLDDLLGFETPALLDVPTLSEDFDTGFGQLGEIASTSFLEAFNGSNRIQTFVQGIIDDAEQIAQRRAQQARANQGPQVDLNTPGETTDRLPLALRERLRILEREQNNLRLNNREREIQNELLREEERLRSQTVSLTDAQRAILENAIRTTQALREQAEVYDDITGGQLELETRLQALNGLMEEGRINAEQFSNELMNIRLEQAQLNIDLGQGSFADGFIVGIENMLEAVRNFQSEAGMVFADFFEQSSEGFAEATANAIVFGDSFSDAIGNAARQAIADLLAGLIKLGLQFVLNATLGQTLGAAATAAGTAQAATLAGAYSTAAAFASLASFGANAVPAQAGIASTVALTSALSALPAFADGGPVSGPGGPRSDIIPALLSNGEFVVNARSAARFRPLLEQINRPNAFQDGGNVGNITSTGAPQAEGQPQGPNGIRIVNVVDPAMVESFLTSSAGERVFVNVLQRNANSLRQILRNN